MKRIADILLTAVLLVLFAACGKSDIVIPSAPEFYEVIPELVKYNVVVLKATCSDSSIESGGFVLSLDGGGETSTVPATVSGGSLEATVYNLKEYTSYSFIAFVQNAVQNRVESEVRHFTTGIAPAAESIVSIPDAFLKAWLIYRFDSDSDGEISYKEAEYIDRIELSSDSVFSLTGIECFPNLKNLHAAGSIVDDSGQGNICEVDLSDNPDIEEIYLVANKISKVTFPQDCKCSHIEFNYNELTEFDASALYGVELLAVSWNKIKCLDLSGLGNLRELHCNDNPLETLTLENKSLEYLDCHGTKIRTLDLKSCPLINKIDCSSCPELKEIILKKDQAPGTITKDPSVTIKYE